MFVFFNVEAFFARGIADVRPMFTWMPILLIFLLAALTMRQWSEEQRSGSMEVLLTLPVKQIQLVLGKFLAVMTMIVIALLLTLPVVILVSMLGWLDWGPVVGGYLAALLMAAAYAAIGLFVSSRTDNQIVALISTVLLGGIFYLVGTAHVTDLVSGSVSNILWAIGTGSRFESIERGVIDLRDLVYYLSLCAIFLTANVISLDAKRWSRHQKAYRFNMMRTVSLLAINLIVLNVWVYPLNGLRLDLTAQKEFTVSQTTKDLISNLDEPLLIRAYISEKTHPALAPLVPQIRDMLREYQIASGNTIQVEVVDPITDPEIESEANQVYGIRPTPLQVSGQNEASIINTYFDILVAYGDQSVVLNFKDLIEVHQDSSGVTVSLKNIEYDLTRAIKKVVYGFQSIDSILAALDKPVTLTFFVSDTTLPEDLQATRTLVEQAAEKISTDSDGKFIFQEIDPNSSTSSITPQELLDTYQIQPFRVSLFSNDTFFFHLLLENGEKQSVFYPPLQDATDADVRTSIESALKQTSTGFLKVVGLWYPSEAPTQDMFGQTVQPFSTYGSLRQTLAKEYDMQKVDLSKSQVPQNIDVLVVVAPQDFTDTELFAIDQYLMRGGSVVIAVNNYKLNNDPYQQQMTLTPVQGNLKDLLDYYGVQLGDSFVLDKQNTAFPVMVNRNVNGQQLQEVQAMNYPYFVDVRQDGMSQDSLITSGLPAVGMDYASPVTLDETKNANRKTEVLLRSSSQSWLDKSLIVNPNFDKYPDSGFPIGEEQQSYPLAVSVQGSFESYFKGKTAPDLGDSTVSSVIDQSPEKSRLVVIGSTEVVDDFALKMSSYLTQDYVTNNLNFFQNAVNWTVEDLDLLSIRSRGTATRVLVPLSDRQRNFWQGLIWAVELVLLLLVYFVWQMRKKAQKPLKLLPPKDESSVENMPVVKK